VSADFTGRADTLTKVFSGFDEYIADSRKLAFDREMEVCYQFRLAATKFRALFRESGPPPAIINQCKELVEHMDGASDTAYWNAHKHRRPSERRQFAPLGDWMQEVKGEVERRQKAVDILGAISTEGNRGLQDADGGQGGWAMRNGGN
jgi:hypothetical protein